MTMKKIRLRELPDRPPLSSALLTLVLIALAIGCTRLTIIGVL
jgi:hypothetical protein